MEVKYKTIYRSEKHALDIVRETQGFLFRPGKRRGIDAERIANITLLHHGDEIFTASLNDETETNILKGLFNSIVDNHNKLNIDYRRKDAGKVE